MLCEANDLICAPINNYADLVEHPQVKAREAIATVAFPDGRTMQTIAPAPRLSATPGTVRCAYPSQIGEHTREILLKVGLSEAEIVQLEADNVIAIYKAAC